MHGLKRGIYQKTKRNTEEEESISDSIYESSTYNDSDNEYISANDIKDIQDGSQIHLYINARDARLKRRDLILKTQN